MVTLRERVETNRQERLKHQYQMERELSRIEDTENVVLMSGTTRYAMCVREIYAAIFWWG